MKRILLTIALIGCTFAAQSQIFVSLNAGGYMSSGNTNVNTRISVATDSTYITDIPHDKVLNLGGGFRFGYKTGKMMFGIGPNFNRSSVTTTNLDTTLIPIPPARFQITTGEMTTTRNIITVAPFFRYDIFKTGDIALFAELNAFYTMQQDPTVNATRIVTPRGTTTPLPAKDTTFTQTFNATGFGARVTPGLSWQLNKYVSLDLYLDFLSLAYASYTTTSTYYNYVFTISNTGNYIVSNETTTYTNTVKTTDMDLGIFGTPSWSNNDPGNFVRVGINFTF